MAQFQAKVSWQGPFRSYLTRYIKFEKKIQKN